MATRKTIEVTEVLRMGNHFLKMSADSETRERQATANLMDSILHHAEAYAGFGYLIDARVNHDEWHAAWEKHREEVKRLKDAGIAGVVDCPRWEDYCKDDTRRVYYMHKKLRPANWGQSIP